MFKSLADERAARKYASWSAHFAWGALIVILLTPFVGVALAFPASVAAGFVWEVAGFLLTRGRWAASTVDAVAWTVGACAGALCVVYLLAAMLPNMPS